MKRICKKHFRAMAAVRDGADVFSYETAGLLREVERMRPSFITIVKPQRKYSGVGQLPYFGAILTREGIAALDRRATR